MNLFFFLGGSNQKSDEHLTPMANSSKKSIFSRLKSSLRGKTIFQKCKRTKNYNFMKKQDEEIKEGGVYRKLDDDCKNNTSEQFEKVKTKFEEVKFEGPINDITQSSNTKESEKKINFQKDNLIEDKNNKLTQQACANEQHEKDNHIYDETKNIYPLNKYKENPAETDLNLKKTLKEKFSGFCKKVKYNLT